jgi:glycosyltransferase involved in cell wall biosynthesis
MLTFHRWLKTWQRHVNIYIALTEFARRKFIQGGLSSDKMVVKPNFVSPDPGLRSGNGHYALFVGRLSPEKGVLTLLQAWQGLRGIPLRIVGDGPLMDQMQAVVQTEKLQWVKVLGRRPPNDIIELMKGTRFLVFPSQWYETFGRVAIEAFACGVPVVASRLGAMAEIVEEGRTGLLFRPGDSGDLAEKVRWAVDHPDVMCRMGEAARREYEEKYTPEKNYKMLLNVYEQAIRTANRESAPQQ